MAYVLVFDSGSGNIPIAKEIRAQLPGANLALLADTEFFPYGERSDAELIERMLLILTKAVNELKPDILVLACNTASTIALDILRDHLSLPIIGVVPAIKPAASASKSKVIGLIATPATIRREYTHNLVKEFAQDCEVVMHSSTELVLMSENFVSAGVYDKDKLRDILFPFKEACEMKNLDQLVLGCTHFALLKDEIAELLSGVEIVDSSEAIANQVLRILGNLTITSNSWKEENITFSTRDGNITEIS